MTVRDSIEAVAGALRVLTASGTEAFSPLSATDYDLTHGQATPIMSIGSVIAVYFLVTGITGLSILGVSTFVQDLFYGGALIVADASRERVAPSGEGVTHSLMVRVDDVDAHFARVKKTAEVVMEPTDMPFGERQYTVRDLAGHRWTFSQTIADSEPESWGGTTVAPYPNV